MKETRAYKLNKKKLPSSIKGEFLYYFYNFGKLDSVSVDEQKWEKLVALDNDIYNNDRKSQTHFAEFNEEIDDNEDSFDFNKQHYYSKECNEYDKVLNDDFFNNLLSSYPEIDRKIYKLYVSGMTQSEIAEEVQKTQGFVAKHLSVIKTNLREENLKAKDFTNEEILVNEEWEKYTNMEATSRDEDIIWDFFRIILPIDIQIDMASWFISYKDYHYCAMKYLILNKYEHFTDNDLDKHIAKLSPVLKTWIDDYLDDYFDCKWLLIGIWEEIFKNAKIYGKKPSEKNYQKIIDKAELNAEKYGMTVEEYIENKFLPPLIAKRKKRYEKYVENSYIYVADENDPRSIREQIVSHVEHCKKLDKKFRRNTCKNFY